MSANLKAAMAAAQKKQEAAEKREAKEQERKRQRDVLQPAAAPAKSTKVLKTAKDRKQAEREKLRAEEPQMQQVQVYKVDGTQIPLGQVLYQVIKFLHEREDQAEVSLEQLRGAIQVSVENDPKLMQALRDNERVEMVESHTGTRLRYAPAYGVRNMAGLKHLLGQNTYPSAGRECETVLRSELKKKTYAGVDEDIGTLLEANVCAKLERKHDKDEVLFRMPAGEPASADVCELWRESKVPKGDELQHILVKRGELAQDEVDERKARKDKVRAAQLAAQQANKTSRAPQIRKFTNAHLQRAGAS